MIFPEAFVLLCLQSAQKNVTLPSEVLGYIFLSLRL
jgi:hypothetical protein